MKVKQINPNEDEIINKLRNGAEICCVSFSKRTRLTDVLVHDLQYETIRSILSFIKEEDNIFFEKVKEESAEKEEIDINTMNTKESTNILNHSKPNKNNKDDKLNTSCISCLVDDFKNNMRSINKIWQE